MTTSSNADSTRLIHCACALAALLLFGCSREAPRAAATRPAPLNRPTAETLDAATRDFDTILAAYRQIIVLQEDIASLPSSSRDDASTIGRTLFENNLGRRRSLAERMTAEMDTAARGAAQYPLTESFLDRLEGDDSLHDADKLAFREVLEELRDHLHALAPSTAKGRSLELRLAEDVKALDEIRGLYEKELQKIFARFETRGMPVRREAWESYVAFLKTKYTAAGVMKENGAVLPPRLPVPAEKPAAISTLPDKTLLLTFDDGPHSKYTPQILDILARYKVKGVFFEVGQNLGTQGSDGSVRLTKAAVFSRRALDEGSLLGNHTNTHAFLPKLAATGVDDELDRTTRMLQAADKVTPQLFRPPYGAMNETVKTAAAARKLRTMLWNIDSLDWEDPISLSVANRVIGEARKARRGVILLHDIHPRAVEALPAILDTLENDGFHFVLWDGRTILDPGPEAAKNDAAPAAQHALYRESWAVVIGINDYQKWPKLTYAVNDAESIRDALVNRFHFQPDHITTLLDGQATRQAILSALGDALADNKRVQKDDRVFVFFAGHGATRLLPSGRSLGYVIPVDADTTSFQSQAISMSNFQDIDDAIPAKHVLYIMDACYSGLALVRGGPEGDLTKFLESITHRSARQMLTAGGADEQVADGGPQGHSIFTWTVLQGLDGRADLNGDGYITASELAAYVAPSVSSVSHQTPVFGSLVGSEGGDFVFELRHEDEFLSGLSKQLDDQAIRLNDQLDQVRKAIAEKRSRNDALAKNLAAATAELKSLDRSAPAPASPAEQSHALNDQGMKLYREKRYDDALAVFRQAFALQPSSALIANNIGYTLFKTGRQQDAVTWYQKTLVLDPNRAIAWSNLGDAYLALGKPKEALEACEKFVSLAPNHPGAASAREKIEKLRNAVN